MAFSYFVRRYFIICFDNIVDNAGNENSDMDINNLEKKMIQQSHAPKIRSIGIPQFIYFA